MDRFLITNSLGDILSISETKPVQLPTKDSFCISLSEKAYEFILKSGIRSLCETESLKHRIPDTIVHVSEKTPSYLNAFATDSLVLFRINYFAPIWNKVKRLYELDQADYISLVSTMMREGSPSSSATNDAAVMVWMKSNEPRWEILEMTSEASALINHSHIECDEEFFPFNDIYIKAREGYLFQNVTELLIFRDNGEPTLLMGHSVTKGFGVASIAPIQKIIEGDSRVTVFMKEGIEFIRKFHAIKECEKTPIEVVSAESKKSQNLSKKGIRKTGGIFRYQISLTKRYVSVKKEKHEAMDKEGKTLAVVKVSGFIRNQAYGEGLSLRKKIWVDSFTRGQWIKTGITYVTVKE